MVSVILPDGGIQFLMGGDFIPSVATAANGQLSFRLKFAGKASTIIDNE